MPYFHNTTLINMLLVISEGVSFLGMLFWGFAGDIHNPKHIIPIIVIVITIVSIYLSFVRGVV